MSWKYNQQQNGHYNQRRRLLLIQHQFRCWQHVSEYGSSLVNVNKLYCSYPANMKCQVTYKPESGCKKMRFSCTDVDLPNRDRKCKRGDYLAIGNKKYDKYVNFSHCKEFKLPRHFIFENCFSILYYTEYYNILFQILPIFKHKKGCK